MHEDEIVEFLTIFIIMEHVQTFVAIEARVVGVSFAAGSHPSGGEGVARATTHAVGAQIVIQDGIVRAIEAVVRREQAHVGEDEHVLAVALMHVDVRLAQSDFQVDETRLRHVGLLVVTQPFPLGPVHDGLAVVDRAGSSVVE